MGKINVSIYMKGDYEDFHGFGASRKQSQFKAKQSQFSALEQTKGAGKREKLFAAPTH